MEKSKHIGIQVSILQALIYRSMSKAGSKMGLDRMKGTNQRIIAFIETHKDQDVFQKDLEREFGITRSAASKAVNCLIRDGYMLHESVPYDARLKKLVLTEKSRGILDVMHAHEQEFEDALTDGFTEEERERILSYLGRLQTNAARYLQCADPESARDELVRDCRNDYCRDLAGEEDPEESDESGEA